MLLNTSEITWSKMLLNTTEIGINDLECFEPLNVFKPANTSKVILSISYVLMIPFVTIINLFLIIGILKTKKGKLKASQKLYILLSCSDISVGVLLLPIRVYLLIETPTSCKESALRAFWSLFPTILSGTTILLISFERYLYVVKYIWYRDHFKDSFLGILVIMDILIAFAWSLLYALVSLKSDRKHHAIMCLLLAIHEVLVLSLTSIWNLKILYYVKKKSIKSTIKESTEARLTKTIGLIGTIMIITYLPSLIGFSVVPYLLWDVDDIETLRKIGFILVGCEIPIFVNSGLNALVYIARNRDIRKKFGICQKNNGNVSKHSREDNFYEVSCDTLI